MTILPTSYLEGLPYLEASKITPQDGDSFFDALNTAYGDKTVKAAMQTINAGMTKFSGTKAFMDRVVNSFCGDKLSGADQVFLNDVCKKIFLKIIVVPEKA